MSNDLATIVPSLAYEKLERLRATPGLPQEDVDRFWYSLNSAMKDHLMMRAFLEAQHNGRAPYLDPNVRKFIALEASPETSEQERDAWAGFPGEREVLQVVAHIVYTTQVGRSWSSARTRTGERACPERV